MMKHLFLILFASLFVLACEGGKDNPADGGEYESLPTKPGEWRAEDQQRNKHNDTSIYI